MELFTTKWRILKSRGKSGNVYYIQYLNWWWPWWRNLKMVNVSSVLVPHKFNSYKSARLYLENEILKKTHMHSRDRYERRRKIKSILSINQ